VHAGTAATRFQSEALSAKSDRSSRDVDILDTVEENAQGYSRNGTESKSVRSEKSFSSTRSDGHSHNSEKTFKGPTENDTFLWKGTGTNYSHDGTGLPFYESRSQEMFDLGIRSAGDSDIGTDIDTHTVNSVGDQQYPQSSAPEPPARQDSTSTRRSDDYEQPDLETMFHKGVLKGRTEKLTLSLGERFNSRTCLERMVIVASFVAAVAAFFVFVTLVSLAPKGGSKKLERGSFTGSITVIWLSIGTGMCAGGRSAVEILMAMTMSLCYGIFLTGQIDVFKT
jgi:hypothetical protein